MKRFFFILCVLSLLMSVSCQKELSLDTGIIPSADTSGTTQPPTSAGAKLYRISQGVNDDTVHRIFYDTSGHINKIVDSFRYSGYVAVDSTFFTYNTNGTLKRVSNNRLSADYTYNTDGLLTELDANFNGEQMQYTFEYGTDGLPAKGAYYSNAGSGPLQLRHTYVYTFNNLKDITNIKEYAPNDVLTNETTLTYTTDINHYKVLSAANLGNTFGFDHLFNIQYFFNAHMLSGMTSNNTKVDITYTTNASKNITRSVSKFSGYTFTLNFLYQ